MSSRKSKYIENHRTCGRMSIRLNEGKLTNKLEQLCKIKNISRQQLVKEILEMYLDDLVREELNALSKDDLIDLLMKNVEVH